MKKGCIVLLIIGALILVCGGLIWINKDKIVDFALNKGIEMMETTVVSSLPSTVSADSVHVLFQSTLEKIKSSEIDADELQKLMSTFQANMADKNLDSLEVTEILAGLKKLNE